jgi:KDO2-lipid IV(A) lauroyltransferase
MKRISNTIGKISEKVITKLGDLVVMGIYNLVTLLVLVSPDKARYKIGVLLGKFARKAVKSLNKLVISNLQLVLGDELSSDELRKIAEENFTNMGLVIIEFILLKRMTKDNFREIIDFSIEGEEYLREAYDRGKGVIIYTAHFDNWEWLGAILAFLGYPVTAIAQEQHNKSFDRSINKTRRKTGVKMIFTRKMSQRAAYTALKNQECLYIIGEQYPVSNGWPVQFFGLSTLAFSGVVRFAQSTGASIVPAFLVREGWRKHRLVIHPSYLVEKKASLTEQEKLLQELIGIVEKTIREHPDQWLWAHERWR